MASIQWTNMSEVMAGIKKRQEKLANIPKVARQMGIMAENEIHPITAKKTGNWDSTIHSEVKQLGKFKYELWVGSKGAFAKNGYNYGARQERLNHPIEIGFHRAQPMMIEHWQKVMHGGGSSVISTAENFEFASMSGF